MGQFVDNLKSLPPAENVVLLRLFDSKDRLVSLIPNLAGKSGPLRVFHHIAGEKEARAPARWSSTFEFFFIVWGSLQGIHNIM